MVAIGMTPGAEEAMGEEKKSDPAQQTKNPNVIVLDGPMQPSYTTIASTLQGGENMRCYIRSARIALMIAFLLLGYTQISSGQVDPDTYMPGNDHTFVGKGEPGKEPEKEEWWYDILHVREDAKKYSPSKIFRLSPVTTLEKIRSKAVGRSFIIRELMNPTLIWEYRGIREWYGDKYHAWITAIEFPGAMDISLYFSKIETDAMIFTFGDKEDESDLQMGGHVYHSPIPPPKPGPTFAGVFKGSTIYIIYYNEDKKRNPLIYPPFVIQGIRINTN